MGKILIAESDPLAAESIRSAFKRFGHTFTVVDEGKRALRLLKNEKFVLAFLENFSDRVNGIEILRSYRASCYGKPVPAILIMSGRATVGMCHEAREVGASDCISKPFNPRELVSKALAVLRQKRRVVCVGGGTGLYMMLMGLKTLPHVHLTSVVSMSDDGGSTGRLREAFGVLPPGDVRRSLVALSSAPQLVNQLLTYRFPRESHLVGHNLGNLMLTALAEMCGSMQESVRAMSEILNIGGIVIPVTNMLNKLVATLENGETVTGESAIDVSRHRDFRLKIVRLRQQPEAEANPEALLAVENAEFIVIGPGDLFTSIVSNLVVKGIPEAVRSSAAKKIYVANLMTKPGETYGMGVEDHVEEVVKYLGGDCLDYVIVSDSSIPQAELKRYAGMNQAPVRVKDAARLKRLTAAEVVEADLASVADYIRHDSYKLTAALDAIFQRTSRKMPPCRP